MWAPLVFISRDIVILFLPSGSSLSVYGPKMEINDGLSYVAWSYSSH